MEALQDSPAMPVGKDSVEGRLLGEELFLFDGEDASCAVHTLNSGAALIWLLCDGSRAAEDMAREISEAFELAEEEVLSQVKETLARFHSLGLLAPAPSRETLPA